MEQLSRFILRLQVKKLADSFLFLFFYIQELTVNKSMCSGGVINLIKQIKLLNKIGNIFVPHIIPVDFCTINLIYSIIYCQWSNF